VAILQVDSQIDMCKRIYCNNSSFFSLHIANFIVHFNLFSLKVTENSKSLNNAFKLRMILVGNVLAMIPHLMTLQVITVGKYLHCNLQKGPFEKLHLFEQTF